MLISRVRTGPLAVLLYERVVLESVRRYERTAGLLEHKETIGAASEAAPRCELQLV